jgi:hypothetical protein
MKDYCYNGMPLLKKVSKARKLAQISMAVFTSIGFVFTVFMLLAL